MLNSRTMLKFFLAAAVLSLLGACSAPPPTPSPADIQTAIAATLTAAPTITETPTPPAEITQEPSPTVKTVIPSATPGKRLDGVVNVAFLNMRSGPSTFFDVVETFEEGTIVQAISRAPDNTWIEVKVDSSGEEKSGWMFAEYVDLDGSISELALTSFDPAQVVSGQVVDEFNQPIPDVSIAVVHSDDNGEQLANAITGTDGKFSVYFPDDLFGILDVQVSSPLCGSQLVDENCQVSSHILLNSRVFVSIPQQDQEVTFVYETAAYTLTGNVIDSRSKPVADIVISARRDDGATSVGYSDAQGDFAIPISEGIWEIFTVKFNPRAEGKHQTITIADTLPDPITLRAPN